MFSRRALTLATRSTRSLARPQPRIPRAPFSVAASQRADIPRNVVGDFPSDKVVGEIDDTEMVVMNGGYINPPRIKRQHRDPYTDWDDKQERRNFGEPVHEDNEVLGIFALEDYTHMTTGRGLLMWGFFISCVLGVSYAVTTMYPGKPSAPREFEGGLDTELGGAGAVRARQAGDEIEDV
ncbi:hypothetical protein LTR99_007976 [Exophiala xenobiotica]|uniref:Uncharacterized protein n=1 Tax=Vermiconidia calcicola TaxID=1690605 RepID=A0AAV9Q4D8_9PEZI|nr:hypothetical protein LTR99_007976 [Exophiala xenobiotica]KAK5429216.1 hypothetical protein LTR34_007676 [Exophiala xenobiotica]KAK5535054.1 hypothetical protein LTR25_006061 [Vermiconidia calcicola]KAK5536234.1 hypothetical protein LTR23_008096 [Chaetothyriales sp. CCFEE 6169]